MKKFILILAFLSLFSCGDVKDLPLKEVRNSDSFVDTVFSSVHLQDTIKKLSKNWISVYYINKGDTFFSDIPFEINFLRNNDNLTFKLNGVLSEEQRWNFQNGLFKTIDSRRRDCYKIISISDSTLRTRDTAKVGYEYFFKVKY